MLAFGLQQRLGQDEVGVGVIALANPVDRKTEDLGIKTVGDLCRDGRESIEARPALPILG
jgi:hypothetical protein